MSNPLYDLEVGLKALAPTGSRLAPNPVYLLTYKQWQKFNESGERSVAVWLTKQMGMSKEDGT